ncbi:MurR/RpiR family transcriptional regulator [Marinococcus sp. PL1-022]|uniref:MurR/RpiR family transcriptional regulator n=1 Tax=Marinococcus sp. PL1-022 TaxID=3095363 RepID=UPI0029C32D66|nr:SIS domain-containing protein [Marinococcus sp. PL1-022]MDX6154501.1 SIS domain-containing protein [Marinococcus sp. PL1-022]
MLRLNEEKLTRLEKRIHETLSETVMTRSNLKIIDAATLCETSPSKVSKLVRKLGFENFKEYKLYFSGKSFDITSKQKSSEIERLIAFLTNYDPKMVDEFLNVFMKFNRIIIFGLGPSFISADYFAYKLNTLTDKKVFATQHEDYVGHLADEHTLLIVFSVTGAFSSFKHLFTSAKEKKSQIMLILEENKNTRDFEVDYIFRLSKFPQNDELLAFEKTRTIFFIFIEEVIARLREKLNEKE